VAKAEAEAEKIKALAAIDISDLQQRAVHRFIFEEARKQATIESITRKAIPHLTADAKPAQIEDDWLTYFFDRCRLVNDEDMQEIWGRILAEESNQVRTYSKKTLELLTTLERNDAEDFTRLCSFVGAVNGVGVLLIFNLEDEIYSKHNISFG